MNTSFAAPPARQASRSLAGKRGQSAAVGLDGRTNEDFDLPLVRFFRRHAPLINATAIVVAVVGAVAFGAPFLLLLGR